MRVQEPEHDDYRDREVSDSKLQSVLLLAATYVNDKLAKPIIKTVDLCEVNVTTKHLIHH